MLWEVSRSLKLVQMSSGNAELGEDGGSAKETMLTHIYLVRAFANDHNRRGISFQ